MIKLKKITENNLNECVALNPGEANSRFVETNVRSLAIAYVNKDNDVCIPMPYAIYKDEIMIGFIMMSFLGKDQDNDVEEDSYDIWRFMIDQKYQGNGYGREALLKAIELVKTFPNGPANQLILSCIADNKVGNRLYKSVGFKPNGNAYEDQIEMSLELIL